MRALGTACLHQPSSFPLNPSTPPYPLNSHCPPAVPLQPAACLPAAVPGSQCVAPGGGGIRGQALCSYQCPPPAGVQPGRPTGHQQARRQLLVVTGDVSGSATGALERRQHLPPSLAGVNSQASNLSLLGPAAVLPPLATTPGPSPAGPC